MPGYERSGTFALAPHFLKQCALLGAVLSRLFRERLEMRCAFRCSNTESTSAKYHQRENWFSFSRSRPVHCQVVPSAPAIVAGCFTAPLARWPASPPARSLLWGKQAAYLLKRMRGSGTRKQSRHQV